MKYRLVRIVEGKYLIDEFDDENFLPAMEVRGFAPMGEHRRKKTRMELQGAPIFSALCGPMWDGDAIRYEDEAANDQLSA